MPRALGITAAIANFAVGEDVPVPDIAIDMAERAVVDTIGVSLVARGRRPSEC